MNGYCPGERCVAVDRIDRHAGHRLERHVAQPSRVVLTLPVALRGPRLRVITHERSPNTLTSKYLFLGYCTMTLDFDPIDEAAANWRGAGWAAVGAMTAATSITRAHQILSGRIDTALAPLGLNFSRSRGARPAVVHQGGRAAVGQGRRPTPGASGLGHQHRQPARSRRPRRPQTAPDRPAYDARRAHRPAAGGSSRLLLRSPRSSSASPA